MMRPPRVQFCRHCHTQVIRVNGRWLHAATRRVACNAAGGQAEPRD